MSAHSHENTIYHRLHQNEDESWRVCEETRQGYSTSRWEDEVVLGTFDTYEEAMAQARKWGEEHARSLGRHWLRVAESWSNELVAQAMPSRRSDG